MKNIVKRLAIKLSSIKTLITIWSCFIISYIVFTKQTDFQSTANILCSVPLAYFVANEVQKKRINNE